MKRHAPGLYTEGDVAVSRECDCSGYCDGRWVEREVIGWVDGWPELGNWGLQASSKQDLVRMINESK
jgi:hypothetical protein